jgi:hypothetical protein
LSKQYLTQTKSPERNGGKGKDDIVVVAVLHIGSSHLGGSAIVKYLFLELSHVAHGPGLFPPLLLAS